MTPGTPSDDAPVVSPAQPEQEPPRIKLVPTRRHYGRPDGWWRATQKKLIAARDVITLPLCRARKNRVKKEKRP